MRYLLLLVPLALLSASLLGLREEEKPKCKVETKEVVRSVYGSGYVKSVHQVEVRVDVTGRVERVFVKEGQRVRRGEVIAIVNSGGLREKIREVEERIRSIREKLEKGSDFRKILDLKVSMAEENLTKAKARYERRRRLFEKGVIPREALEEAERSYLLALKNLEIARREREEALRDLRNQIRSLLRTRDAMREELEKYTVRSPIDGFVLRVYVEEGDTVNPIGGRDLVATLGSREKEVVLLVDEEFAPLVREGQRAYLYLEALPGRVVEGRVRSKDLESDPSRRVVRVRVEADLPEDLPVNSVAEGNIIIDVLKTTVVPREAVRDGYVTLVVGGERRRVKVNRIFKDFAEVIGYPEGTPCEIP